MQPAVLDAAERVIASELTIVECDRALIRAVALGRLEEAAAVERAEGFRASPSLVAGALAVGER